MTSRSHDRLADPSCSGTIRSRDCGHRPLVASLLGASLLLNGCTTWRVETIPAAEVVARDHPAELRIQPGNGHWEVLHTPVVRGDSLIGRHYANAKHPDRAVALPDVTAVATHHFNSGKTILLGVGVAGILGIAYLIAIASLDPLGGLGQ